MYVSCTELKATYHIYAFVLMSMLKNVGTAQIYLPRIDPYNIMAGMVENSDTIVLIIPIENDFSPSSIDLSNWYLFM